MAALTLTSRPYATLDDFYLMKALLIAGKRANPTTGFHMGDLNWWLFYDASGIPTSEKARLWELGGKLIGWTWVNPHRGDFDMVMHPDYRGSAHEAEIILQTVDTLSAHVLAQPSKLDDAGEPQQRTISAYAFRDETARIAFLESLGFTGADFTIDFVQDIRRELPAPQLPDGFHFLDRMELAYADQRADVHLHAFQPQSKMNADYYRHFMTSPDYDPELDVVVVAPDGRFASFVMAWIDPDNRLSIFEPVGTRGEMQRRGLGRAAQLEALRRLKQRGVETALVATWADDKGNIAFYESAGFRSCNMQRVYTKVLNPAG